MTDETGPWLVVGLGNPGREYAGNRHNVGFMVADLLAGRLGAKFGRHRRAVAEVAEGRLGLGGPKLVLAKPLTYMNLSGGPVVGLAQFYKVSPGRVIAVHDELDIGYGQVRVKCGGGEGGHNGLRSMSKSLGTKDYVRVRFGIGRRRDGRIRRTMCCRISARWSARSWTSWWIGPRTWWSPWSVGVWSRPRTSTTASSAGSELPV